MEQELKWHQIRAADASAEWDSRLGVTIYVEISRREERGWHSQQIALSWHQDYTCLGNSFHLYNRTPRASLSRRLNCIHIQFYSHNCDRYSYLLLNLNAIMNKYFVSKIHVTFLKLIFYFISLLFLWCYYENSLIHLSFDWITSNKNFKVIHG